MSIKKAVLNYKDQKSDKVYEVEIVYLAWEQYHVNYAYGKTGTKLKQGTKTTNLVSLQEAEKIYDDLVKSKKDKGYRFTSCTVGINEEFLLAVSLKDRQNIIDHFKQQNPDKLLEEINKVGINFQEHLRGIDLSNANLENADLRDCDLSQTNLCGANLTGAKLQGTNLENIQIDANTQIDSKWRLIIELIKFGGENRNLAGIDLSHIELSCYYDYEIKINLSGANLEGANLSESNLYNFDFSNANLKNANLHKSRLYYFPGANLEGANLSDAELGEADFTNAICINTNFSRMSCNDEFIRFENANFTGANFQEAVFTECLISGAKFTNANFTGAIGFERFISGLEDSEIVNEVSFKNANLSKIDISNCDYLIDSVYGIELINWQGAKFDDANLSNTDFSGFTFKDVSFRNANLKGASLEKCNLECADFTGANLEDANLQNADLRNCNLSKTNLCGVNLIGVKLQRANIENAEIDANTQIDPKWRLILELIKFGGENRDLRGVDLSHVDLGFSPEDGDFDPDDVKINLSGANLEGANLSESNLYSFNFSDANLKNADLHKSILYYFPGANLEDANLSDTYLYGTQFFDAICINTNFSRVSFEFDFIGFENADCTGANFQEADFRSGQININGANFTNANFTGALAFDAFILGFEDTSFTEKVSFKNANLSEISISPYGHFFDVCGIELINWQGAKFERVNLPKTDFSGLNLQDVSFKNANLKGANFENCNLQGADFTDANLEDANLKGVDIGQVSSFENSKVNENTQVDEKWQDWLKEHQQKS